MAPAPVPKRKKSLPGSADAPMAILSREEASVLSSQRREEVRRQAEEAERYRANPLLYFCSPQLKVRMISRKGDITLVFASLDSLEPKAKLLSNCGIKQK